MENQEKSEKETFATLQYKLEAETKGSDKDESASVLTNPGMIEEQQDVHEDNTSNTCEEVSNVTETVDICYR